MKLSVNRSRLHGFTLVEILAVVAILALLMGIGVGVYSVAMNTAKRAKTQSLIKKLEVTLEALKVKYGVYPQVLSTNTSKKFYLGTESSPTDMVTQMGLTGMTEYANDFIKMIDYESVRNTATSKDSTGLFLVDAWGNPLVYKCPGDKNKSTFDIISYGPNKKIGETGAAGTEGTADDLANFN